MKKQENFGTRLLAAVSAMAVMLSVMAFPAYAEDSAGENTADTATTTIQIVHTNDIHGYYTATNKGVLGFATLKTFAESVGADLLLDAGDTYHGQAFATVEQGMSIAELMKAVGYDAMTPGNHDWSYGAARLKELETAQEFPILAANVVEDASGNSYFNNTYLIKDVTADDGTPLKVGVVGVIDSGFYNSTASDNVAGITFTDQAAVASEIAKKLKEDEGCNIVVALTHCADPESFVGGLSNVDAVVAGHQHILIDTQYNDADGKSVYVVEAGYYFYNIGVLSLTYDTNTQEITGAEEKSYSAADLQDVSANADIENKIAEMEARENATLSQPIGQSNNEYPYSWEEIRVAEQPIGRIITAAYLARTGADVAFENAGGVRGGIPQGAVTYKDLIGISPYGNTIVTKELTGSQILAIVEYSLELSRQCDEIYTLQKEAFAKGEDYTVYQWPKSSGSVLQFGGISVQYDMSKPSGSRIISAQIGGAEVDPDKTYTVATNNYAAENASYPGLSQAPLVKEYGTCEQALLAYIKNGEFEQAAEKANLTAYQPVEEPEPDNPDNGNTGDNSGENAGDNSSTDAGNNANDNTETAPTSQPNAAPMPTATPVEPPQPTAAPTPTTTAAPTLATAASSQAASIPKTADDSPILIYITSAGLSALALLLVGKRKKKIH